MSLSPALDPSLSRKFPRDFSRIPLGTDLGESDADVALNEEVAKRRLDALETELYLTLKQAVHTRERPILTSALMPGGNVILHALHSLGLLSKVPVILIDTFHMFDETLLHLRELERHYGFQAKVYHAKDFANADEFRAKHGMDFVEKDTEQYDMLCKVEPMNRALQEHDSDCWMNGRRRDHGAERARLAVWEEKKLNPLAFWTFEDCWAYLRRHRVPYHPLHDMGFPSIGDTHSSARVPWDRWFVYGGERSGRFQNLLNSDGSQKTECGLHTKISTNLTLKQ